MNEKDDQIAHFGIVPKCLILRQFRNSPWTGMANGAYVALVLEVLDKRKRGASTGYALMSSSGNVPPIYMTWLDGIGYRHGGARGLMATDAVFGGLGGLMLFAVARHLVKPGSAPSAKSVTA